MKHLVAATNSNSVAKPPCGGLAIQVRFNVNWESGLFRKLRQVCCRVTFWPADDGCVVRKGEVYMKLKDFPYTTTNRLAKYAKLVTKAIALFNRNYAFLIGTIAHDSSYGLPPNEDLLEYWDDSTNIISYGRYLLLKTLKEK